MYNLEDYLFNNINIIWYDEEDDDTDLEDILLRDRWETGHLRM